MIVLKKQLSRRTLLRGVLGTAVALPFLDAMVPALSAGAATSGPFRFGAIYTPNGMCPGQWEPRGEGDAFEFSPAMKPLEPFREQMVVVSGLYQSQPFGDPHQSAGSMWLNGTFPKRTEGPDVACGTTLDQLIAERISRDTLLPSMQLGTENLANSIGSCTAGWACLYQNTLSWRTPTSPLPFEINPRIVFKQMFGETGTAAQRRETLEAKHSILDAVTAETARLQRRLGPGDRLRLDEYLDNVRQIEQRIQRAEHQASSDLSVPPAPSGVPASFEEHIKLMFDLQFIAFQADLTRVFTFSMGHEASDRSYPWIDIPESHHTVSHHGGIPETMAKYTKINVYHTQFAASFLERLRATPDGDGSLFDHSLFMYGSGMSDGNGHVRSDLPIVVLGGASGQLNGGRRIQIPTKTVPLANLLVALGQKAGLTLDHLGESTGRVDL